MKRLLTLGFLFALLLLFIITGFYSVEPDENAVGFVLGKAYYPDVQPGIHWNVPWPFGKVVVAKTMKNYTMGIGYGAPNGVVLRTLTLPGILNARMNNEQQEQITVKSTSGSSDMARDSWMTAGASVLKVQVDIQYSVQNLSRFLLLHETPELFLEAAGRHALGMILLKEDVDEILTRRRHLFPQLVKLETQSLLDNADTGIQVKTVTVELLSPPAAGEVAAAFQDVQNARSDTEAMIQKAMAYRSQTTYEAQAKAEQMKNSALAAKRQRIELAKGEADRFRIVAQEYLRSPTITLQRLYLERMSHILPRCGMYIMSREHRTTKKLSLPR
jgi:modulator of FtsH protease HflK